MLETRRLRLRTMRLEDVDDLLVIFSDLRVMASFGGELFDRSQMQAWVKRNLEHQALHGYGLFSVIHKVDDVLIGDCGLTHLEIDGHDELELGYDLHNAYWNQGLATEAACAVRDYALKDLGRARLVSLVAADNLASGRVAQKVGMQRERTVVRGGKTYWLYALTAP